MFTRWWLQQRTALAHAYFQAALSLPLLELNSTASRSAILIMSYQGERIEPFQRSHDPIATFRRCWMLPAYAPSGKYWRFEAFLSAILPRDSMFSFLSEKNCTHSLSPSPSLSGVELSVWPLIQCKFYYTGLPWFCFPFCCHNVYHDWWSHAEYRTCSYGLYNLCHNVKDILRGAIKSWPHLAKKLGLKVKPHEHHLEKMQRALSHLTKSRS